MVRRSLDLRSWEAAQRLIRDWEIEGKKPVTVSEAADRFIADRSAAHLSPSLLAKYRAVADELKQAIGSLPLRSVTVDDLRRIKESWKLAPITIQKRLERLRKFFTFCVDSDWMERNPAKRVKLPTVKYDPTLPFTDEQMEKILWAAEFIREAHPKIPEKTPAKLTALIFLMRYAGLRISDACMFRSVQLADGKIFLRQEKTKQPVWVPVPQKVTDAIAGVEQGREFLFYDRIGTPKSCITEWQKRLKLVYEFAGIPDGHSHRLRDTFSVDLLSHGIPIEYVSKLLGHTSVRTTERHYAPWVKARQDALEAAVTGTWK
jgi:integrase